MEIIKSERLGEEYYRVKHSSGATILLYPMKGYSTAYALFGTKYGSVDTTFKTADDADFVTVPEGIAHYLEHKLFENEECDAFKLYAKTGAEANAYTSFDKTAYLFSCSQKFEENLEILLNFVQEPYFTDETVAKEQGIIGQEIRMYDDDPGWCVMFNCLQAMYHNNPVRIDIAGTVESISRINKELLYRCYNTFYNLNNMVISIAGNFDKDKALEICDRLLKPSKDIGLEAIIPDEPYEIKEKRRTQKLSCSIPMFNIGFKFPEFKNGAERYRNFVLYNVLMEMVTGKTSDFYSEMYENGLLNDNYNVGVFCGRGFFAVLAEGESKNSDLVFEKLKEALYSARKNGLSEKDFTTIKNKTYGELVAAFNRVSSVANNLQEYEMYGIGIFDSVEIAACITNDDVKEALDKLDIENSAISIIEPAD